MIQQLSGRSSFQVAMIATIPFLASWPAMLALGWSSDRTGERRWHTAAAYAVLAVGLAGSRLGRQERRAGCGYVLVGRHRHQRTIAGVLGATGIAAGRRGGGGFGGSDQQRRQPGRLCWSLCVRRAEREERRQLYGGDVGAGRYSGAGGSFGIACEAVGRESRRAS